MEQQKENLPYTYVSPDYLSGKKKKLYQDHVVIFSMKMVGHNFIEDLQNNKHKVLLAENTEHNLHLENIEKTGAIIFRPTLLSPSLFDAMQITSAKACIVAYDDDALNIQLSVKIIKYLQEQGNDKDVRTICHVGDKDNYEAISDYIDLYNSYDKFDLEVFNIYSAAAQRTYDLFPPHDNFNFNDDSDENAIAIIGYNLTAEYFITENLILSHYRGCKNIKIYVADKEADTHVYNFMYKHPYCREFIDVIPVKMLNNKFFANFNWSKELIEKLSKVKAVYFFGDRGAELMNLAARFRQFLAVQSESHTQTPLIICQPEDIDINSLVDNKRGNTEALSNVFKNYLNTRFVSLRSDTCTATRILDENDHSDKLARIINYYYSIKYEFESVLDQKFQCTNSPGLVSLLEKRLHELAANNNALTENEVETHTIEKICEVTGHLQPEVLKYFSIKTWWDYISEQKKSANRYAARHLNVKVSIMKGINCYPLTTENIMKAFPVIAPIEHKRWSAEKMALNYRFGALPADKKEKTIAKDVLKIHDQLIPYDKLDDENKEKDLNIFLLMPLLNSLKVETN